MAELSYLWEENSLRLKATQSGHEFYAERTAYVGTVEDLLHSSPELTAVHGNEKSHIISLEQGIFSKLSQKGLTFSKDEKLTPLAALGLVWWLHQEHQPTVDELSAVIYRPENKEIRLRAAILYNHSHYGNRYGEIADISTADLNDWGMKKLSAPENPVSRAVRALRVIHDGINARPAILQSLETKLPPEAYLANGFAPKNVQGSYLKREPADLGKMILAGCGQIGFDTCRQQDFTQFLDFEHAVGSLAFSLKTTLKLHYQLQGKALAELEGKNTEQLYKLLLQEEEQLHQAGGGRYSPTAIFLSHFSQSNEVEPLNFEQAAIVFNGVAKNIDVSHLSAKAQMGFGIIKRAADNIVARKAMDIEYLRFSIELKELAKFLEPSHPLYILAHYRLYKTEPEKIERQLDYLDMRFAYRAPPKIFNDDEAIHNILIENKIKDIYFPRQYVYRQDPQFGFSEKKFDSPFDEFKRRRDASNRFVANMSMPGNNGRSIDVYKTLDEKKNEYYERLKSSQALLAKAIEKLIDDGQRPVSWALQNKINALASDYRPESENARFWRNAWTSLEEHWVCKLPLPNPMCTIARVEGPRSRNEKENMAAGMVSMLMEVGQLRGMERGVKLIENTPQGVNLLESPELLPTAPELDRQTIQSPHGKPIEIQRIELKDPQMADGIREAWVRQGSSGAYYWEVDLATGKDLGVVMKQGPEFSPQGRLPGGGPFLSKRANPNFNPKIKLGKHIGSGLTAEVYLDANNPGFVLKKIKAEDLDSVLISSEFENEVKFFNRFYGEGAAEIISQDNQLYIRMYHIPGKGLAQINTKIFPANARKQFLSMAEDLERYNIIHNDFSFNNVLYDQENNTFYPIDFGSAEEGYYPLSDGQRALRFTGKFELMLEHIEKYTRH
ncbi:hypothetical protein [Yersinia enterocolitica]